MGGGGDLPIFEFQMLAAMNFSELEFQLEQTEKKKKRNFQNNV